MFKVTATLDEVGECKDKVNGAAGEVTPVNAQMLVERTDRDGLKKRNWNRHVACGF